MNLSLDLRSVVEKLVVLGTMALLANAWVLYKDVKELVDMKEDLKVVQQYLAHIDKDS